MEHLEENLELLRREVEARKPSPLHALFAAYIGALHEIGLLNQGELNLLSRLAAKPFHDYLRVRGLLHKPEGCNAVERLMDLVKQLHRDINVGGEVRVEEVEPGVVEVRFQGTRCRLSPAVVGLPCRSALCLFPRLIEHLARLEGIDLELIVDPRRGAVEKDGEWCVIRYRVRGWSKGG